MKNYKLTYLVSADLETEKMQSLALKIESLIQKEKGILTGERISRKIDLGNSIKDQKESESCLLSK